MFRGIRIPRVSRFLTVEFRAIKKLSNSRLLLSDKPGSINDQVPNQFTQEEYDNAKKIIEEQIMKLEKNIKGDVNQSKDHVLTYPLKAGNVKIENLSDLLRETIQTTGPIPLSAYIRQCLTHPQFGYYTTRDPLDTKQGDFVTSPEISSMFGEMIGIWLYTTYLKQGMPKATRVIEFGPGRGTLMYDCLKSFHKLCKQGPKMDIILIEASEVLREKQRSILCGDNELKKESGYYRSQTIWGNWVTWVDTEKDIEERSDTANYILAHEFFDALPIKSFERTENGWREFVVEHSPSVKNTQQTLPNPNVSGEDAGITEKSNELKTEFHLTLTPKETPSSVIPALSPRFKNMHVGTRIEICTEAELYIAKMIQLLNNKKGLGAILIMDYGLSSGVPDNTLRGIYNHKFVSPFYRPGEVDLSANVDFENLKLIASKYVDTYGPAEQGDFLHELGIGIRAEKLINSSGFGEDMQDKIYKAYLRLTSKDENGMGKAYKCICFLPRKSSTPLGFGGGL